MHESDFQQALERYAYLRAAAFRAAEAEARQNSGIRAPFRFSQLGPATLDTWRYTWRGSQPFGYGGWNWPGLVKPVWRRPSGFHLAIWSQDQLCGLSVGRASKRRPGGRRHTLSIHFLEGNPDSTHPLKGHVANLAIACADAYAAALGARTLRLVDPLPGLLRLYWGLGFSIATDDSAPLYLERSIAH
jgi:hypothetical protein